jgi:hypothetical protein
MGAPDEVAAASAIAGDTVARAGPAAVLAEIPSGWVRDALVESWPAYGDGLAEALRTTATAAAPDVEDLRRLLAPVAVVALTDDPLHPASVADRWVHHLPSAALVRVSGRPDDPSAPLLGRAGVEALTRLGVLQIG